MTTVTWSNCNASGAISNETMLLAFEIRARQHQPLDPEVGAQAEERQHDHLPRDANLDQSFTSCVWRSPTTTDSEVQECRVERYDCDCGEIFRWKGCDELVYRRAFTTDRYPRSISCLPFELVPRCDPETAFYLFIYIYFGIHILSHL